MNTLEIAQLKDGILKYLKESPREHCILESVYGKLNLISIPIEVVKGYVEEMAQDNAIISSPMTGNRTILMLTNIGSKILYEGGYVKRQKDELEKTKLLEIDPQKYREKTDLEIENLKASIENYKQGKKRSNIIIIISILSLLVSLLFNIF